MKLRLRLEGNDKIIVKNVLGAFLVKGGALIVTLLSTPAFITYFNDQTVLGVWYTLLSVLTWFLNFDLGIGNGIRNNLVEAFTQKDMKKAREVISSGLLSCLLVTLALSAVGVSLCFVINWNTVLNISAEILPSSVLRTSVLVVFAAIMLRFLLTTVNSMFYALQMSAVNNGLALCVSVLQLLYVLLFTSANPREALVHISVVFLVTSNLPLLVAAVVLFCTKLRAAVPSVWCIQRAEMKKVLKVGGAFFLCQIFYMLIVNTNEFLISFFFDPTCTTEYTFYYKITSILSMLVTLAMTPIWSAVTKGMTENNWPWIRSLYQKLKWLAWGAVAVCFCVVPFLQPIMDVWLGAGVLKVELWVSLSFALFGGAFIYSSILSTLVCGMARMKLQAICYGVGVVLKMLFVVFFARRIGSWSVIVWSNAVVLIPYCVLQQIDLNRYLKKKIHNTEIEQGGY